MKKKDQSFLILSPQISSKLMKKLKKNYKSLRRENNLKVSIRNSSVYIFYPGIPISSIDTREILKCTKRHDKDFFIVLLFREREIELSLNIHQ